MNHFFIFSLVLLVQLITDNSIKQVPRCSTLYPQHPALYMTYPSLPEEIEMFLAFLLRKPKTGDRIAAISRLVPGAGLEPARPFGSTDFKSVVSTNSTIQA